MTMHNGITKKDYAPDWVKIPTDYNWVAVDCDGDAFAYHSMPFLPRHGFGPWLCSTIRHYIGNVGWPDDNAWREMIYERPK